MAKLPRINSEGLRLAKREGAARVSSVVRVRKPVACEGCDQNYADPPSKLCPGCQAYQEHQS